MLSTILTNTRTGQIRVGWKAAVFVGLAVVAHALALVSVLAIAHLNPRINPVPIFPLAAALFILACSWISLRFMDGQPVRAIGVGLDRRWPTHLTLGILSGAALLAGSWAIFIMSSCAAARVSAELSAAWASLISGAILCIGVALQEELLFRGYFFQILARRDLRIATILSGLLFVATHLPNAGGASPLAILNIFLLHVLFVACYLRTRSLWVPIGQHAAWNFAQAFVFGMPLSGRKPPSSVIVTEMETGLWAGNEFGPEGGLVVTVMLEHFLFLCSVSCRCYFLHGCRKEDRHEAVFDGLTEAGG
ncbi:MAG: lysostaphin resistance A-like protein, partial [Planctomycetota bacterium]